MLNIAHRGYSGKYPENTMLAFERAIEAGADGIEFDLQMSKDGALVIIHDETLERTTDGTGNVCDYTLAELRALDAGQGERLPTLGEYLDMAKDTGIITNIELKNGIFEYEGMEALAIAEVRKRNMEDRIIFSSFNHYSIQRCLKLAPEIARAFLCGSWMIDMGEYLNRHEVQYLHPSMGSVCPSLVDELHEHGAKVNVWTVNKLDDMRHMINLGADGIITNEVELLNTLLK